MDQLTTQLVVFGSVLAAFLIFFWIAYRHMSKKLTDEAADTIKHAIVKAEEIKQEKVQERIYKAANNVTVHIRVVDETLIRMTDAERIAYLEKLGEEQRKVAVDWRVAAMEENRNPKNPFPDWVIGCIKTTADKYDGECEYDFENKGYAVKLTGNRAIANKFQDALDIAVVKAASETEETREWKLNNRMISQIFLANEDDALNELADHLNPGSSAKATRAE